MRILIIEDEKDIYIPLQKSLTEEGFVVDVAEDGEKGVYLVFINHYDVIILDFMLPEMDGDEVCKQIRKKGINTPIIMLSAKSSPKTKTELLNIGADDYMTKPYSLAELLARIKALLRRPKQIKQEILEVDGLVLDSKKYEVKRDGKKIKLTRKEFSLLEYLMQNKGILLSRGMILEHVWDMNADPFSNTIESHILSLRKKINDNDPKKGLIQTIHGRGYKIKDV